VTAVLLAGGMATVTLSEYDDGATQSHELQSNLSKWILLTHTHRLMALLSGTTWVSRYQKGKTNMDFTGARDSEWQWHQLGRMPVCTSLQTDNHASTPPLCVFRVL